jgi:hypothetical protein
MKLIIKTEDAEALLKKFKDEVNSLNEIHNKLNNHIQSKTLHYDDESYFHLTGAKDLKFKPEIKLSGELEFYFEDEAGSEEELLKSFFQVIIYFLISRNVDVESFEVIFQENSNLESFYEK